MILTALVAARFLHFASLAAALGAALALLGRDSGLRSLTALRAWARRALILSAALALTTAILLLGATAANLSGTPSGAWDSAMLSTIVQETEFGRVWVVRLTMAALLLGVAALAVRRARRTAADAASALLALGLLASLALTGHAAVQGGAEGLTHRLANAVHLIAAGVWLGSLPPFLFMLRQGNSGEPANVALAAERLAAFHTIGLAAVLALGATGLVNSWFLVRTPANLLTTSYGLLLTAKLVLFAAMVALAADNRLRLVPNLRIRGSGEEAALAAQRVRASIGAEWLLGLLLLVAVALLGVMEPAASDPRTGSCAYPCRVPHAVP